MKKYKFRIVERKWDNKYELQRRIRFLWLLLINAPAAFHFLPIVGTMIVFISSYVNYKDAEWLEIATADDPLKLEAEYAKIKNKDVYKVLVNL